MFLDFRLRHQKYHFWCPPKLPNMRISITSGKLFGHSFSPPWFTWTFNFVCLISFWRLEVYPNSSQWRSLESIPHTSAAPPHFIVAQCSMLNKVNAHLAHTECNGTEWTVCSVLQCSIIRYVHCTVLCKSAQSGELSQASFAREGDHVVLGISNDGDLVHIATKLCVVAIVIMMMMMMMICWWW